MKKRVFIMTVMCLLCLTACQTAEPAVTTLSPTVPPNAAQVDAFDPALWNEYSDYELMEMTMESPQNEFRQLSAVRMSAEEWKEYMLENCEPFRALMLRDTAKESIQEHTLTVIDQYKGSFASNRGENLALLVMTIYPEMLEQLQGVEISYPPSTETDEALGLEISN